MTWRKIEIAEDDQWIEHHKKVMHPISRRHTLKVWLSSSGDYMASKVYSGGDRSTKRLIAETIEQAMQRADEWVL